MSGKIVVWIWLFLLVVLAVAVCSGLSCDNGLQPVPAKDYVFYFNDASYADQYFRYLSASKRVDTLSIPYDSRSGFAVSADGKRLYLSDGTKTVVMTSDSFRVITEIPYGGGVSVSPNNQLISIFKDGIRILRTSDYSLVFSDTDNAYHGVFSSNSQRFYCVAGWVAGAMNPPYAMMIDVSKPEFPVTRRTFADGGAWRISPAINEEKWFLLLKFGTFGFLFAVYDCARDSIIFREFLTPGSGDIELTPDGRYAFFTNPGTLLIGPTPSPFVTVFDIQENQVVDTIVTRSPVNNYMFPQNLAITPDGRKLVAEGAPGQGEFSVIDVTRMRVVEHYYLGNSVDIWDVICQNAP